MRRGLTVCGLLIGLTIAHASGLRRANDSLPPKSGTDAAAVRAQSPYQRQDTWYEFILKQFNPDNVDYGNWLELQRRNLIEFRLKNAYFLSSVWTTIALILAAAVCLKQRIDYRRAMSITAEMMADLYNQDAYSCQVAQEAIERYNRHIERCNRVIEGGERPVASSSAEIEQVRTELMRVAEERDTAIRERDVAREELRRKSEILADMSVRLDAATSRAGAAGTAKTTSDVRGADARLVTHINNLQEQLYAERTSNRRLKGGSQVRVAVIGFGTVWRHRLGKRDVRGRLTKAVYYNTTGVLVSGNVRQRPQICGYARFDAIGGFDPNHPSRMIGRVFECAEPCVWIGYNKLLFRRLLNRGECPDCFLVVAKSEIVGQLPVGNQEWRSPDTWLLSLGECVGQQEAMVLMSIGDWVRTSVGKFVLEPPVIGGSLPRLVLRAGE